MSEPPKNDAILRSIGAALHNWSLVELELATLFANLMGFDGMRKAHAIFGVIISFETRIAICDRLVALDARDEADVELWAKLSARLSKFYKKRHELAHFSLAKSDTDSMIVPFMTTDHNPDKLQRRLKRADIQERSRKFAELRDAVSWFARYFVLRRTGQQGEARIAALEEPPLVPQLRELAALSLAKRKGQPPDPQG